MQFEKILVLSDKKIVENSYKALLQEYGELVFEHAVDLEKLFNISYNNYDLYIIDIEDKKKLYDILIFLKDNISKQLLVVISTFDINEMQKLIDLYDINFFIQKPYIPKKLLDFLDKQLQKKYQLSIVTKKADVLIDIIDKYPSDVGIFDNNGNLFYANGSYQNYFKLDITTKKTHFNDFFSKYYSFEYIKSKLFVVSSHKIEHELLRNKWHESLFFFSSDNYLIHIITDISAKKYKYIDQELKNLFFENTSEGVMITDKEGTIESINEAFTQITGYLKDEAIGKIPNILKSNIHDDTFYKKLWNDISIKGYYKGEVWNKRKNGQIYPQFLSITKAYDRFTSSYYYLSLFSDITTLKEADKKIYYYANYDSLTKLPNRSYFYKQFKAYIKNAKEKKDKFALLFIDLDKFKEVNDTFGHKVGDKMLNIVSKRLSNSIRNNDFLARLGGDEFVIIFDKTNEIKDINTLAKKIQDKVSQQIEIDGHIFQMTLSIGIAIYPEHGKNEEELLQNADIAMYEVKNSGRVGTVVFDNQMFEKISSLASLKEELLIALKKNEICFFYNPIFYF